MDGIVFVARYCLASRSSEVWRWRGISNGVWHCSSDMIVVIATRSPDTSYINYKLLYRWTLFCPLFSWSAYRALEVHLLVRDEAQPGGGLCKNLESRYTCPVRLLENFRQLYVLLGVSQTASNVYVSYQCQSGVQSESGRYIFLDLLYILFHQKDS